MQEKLQYATMAACCVVLHGFALLCTDHIRLSLKSAKEADRPSFCLQVAIPATKYCDCFLCYRQTTEKHIFINTILCCMFRVSIYTAKAQ